MEAELKFSTFASLFELYCIEDWKRSLLALCSFKALPTKTIESCTFSVIYAEVSMFSDWTSLNFRRLKTSKVWLFSSCNGNLIFSSSSWLKLFSNSCYKFVRSTESSKYALNTCCFSTDLLSSGNRELAKLDSMSTFYRASISSRLSSAFLLWVISLSSFSDCVSYSCWSLGCFYELFWSVWFIRLSVSI